MSERVNMMHTGTEPLHRAACMMAGRVAGMLDQAFPGTEGLLASGLGFLKGAAETGGEGETETETEKNWPASRTVTEWWRGNPRLNRLVRKYGWTPMEVDLLVLAGMPDEHEGFASVFRSLHPRNDARASVGLAAQVFGHEGLDRRTFREQLEVGPLITSRALRVVGDGPFFERSLVPAEALWSSLHGIEVWPANIVRQELAHTVTLDEWCHTPGFHRTVAAIEGAKDCIILVTDEEVPMAVQYAAQAVNLAGHRGIGIHCSGGPDPEWERLASLHLVMRGMIPIIQLSTGEGQTGTEAPRFHGHPGPIVICSRPGVMSVRGQRPVVAISVGSHVGMGRTAMWRQLLPQCAEQAEELASRFPMDPMAAAEVAGDLSCLQGMESRPLTISDVAGCIRARAGLALTAGMKLVRPQCGWDDLVLPADRHQQLKEVVDRLRHQTRVLDDWGVLSGRSGARGVRLLFAGPPGTGKTLAAEVLAQVLEVDLLVVDVSRVVSKWIGETEKNLSAVFDAAERAQAVLFFDEADALFGKRTEVSDAHDRYANLETAYLLARLEKFEGIAILATNLRDNIDGAFVRRLEFVVEFEEPGREERYRLWSGHVPKDAPLAEDVNLSMLSALYPVVGGTIRNAAVAAAFLAASDGTPIAMTHFIHAIRREYEKAGRAFPAVPHGIAVS